MIEPSVCLHILRRDVLAIVNPAAKEPIEQAVIVGCW